MYWPRIRPQAPAEKLIQRPVVLGIPFYLRQVYAIRLRQRCMGLLTCKRWLHCLTADLTFLLGLGVRPVQCSGARMVYKRQRC